MLDEKFTPETLARSVTAGDEQSFFHALEIELMARIDAVVRPAVTSFVSELNDRGFSFEGPESSVAGEMKFRCEAMAKRGLDLKQVLAVDVVITTGRCL